ncbi:class I SAM-dependent methyltransferase [Halovivax gelatinilyticus]|uniref:class I SAM-dependent methyltransferase n=1 Tax=Halovivax gelatinilyticus TaxID=2961597 RepID=UPI0020CA7B18|nr:class I SAM-dependent methyltransferase [Halovivax gelatinilyticus]
MDEDDASRSITTTGYDTLAERGDAIETSPWGDSAYQRHYVWPGVEPLLPDLSGTRVLDAGCGIGEYVGRFLDRDADVVGVDASTGAVETARERHGDRVRFHQADLTEPLEFASDDAFDLVFCNLVLDHVADWRPTFAQFRRLLDPDGTLVFTTIHPTRRYRRHREELSSYHEIDSYVLEWGETDARVVQYHRPIQEIVDSLSETGFHVEEFREITPQERYESRDPDRYETAVHEPDTLCVRTRPTDTDS